MGRSSLEAINALRMRAVRAVREARLGFFFAWLGFFAGAAGFFFALAVLVELFAELEPLAALDCCPRTIPAPRASKNINARPVTARRTGKAGGNCISSM